MTTKGFTIKGSAKTSGATNPLSKLHAEIEKLRGSTDGVAGKFGALGGILKSTGGQIAAVAATVTAAAVAVNAFSQESLKTEALFKNLTISIEGARKSTSGFISDMDLARAASDAVSFGVVKNSRDFADFAEAAQLVAAKTGQDAGQAISGLSEALGKNSAEILNNYGILLTVGQAQEEYAAQLGIATNELTEIQKQEAFRVVGLQKLKEITQGVKFETDDWRASVQRTRIEIENMKTSVLGGQQGVDQFHLSLVELVEDGTLPASLSLRTYGADAKRVRQALIELGHSTSSVAKFTDKELAGAFDSAAKKAEFQAEATRKARIEAEKLAKAQLFQSQTADSFAAQVHELDKELVILQAMNAEETIIEETMRKKAALLMEEAALRGDILKVIELQRQEELRQITAATAPKKRRGGGRDSRSEFEKALGFRKGSEARFDRFASSESDFDRSDIDGFVDPTAPEELTEAQLDEALRAYEADEARREEHLKTIEDFNDRQFQLEKKAAKERDKLRKEELKAEQQAGKDRMEVATAVSDTMIAAGGAALRAALMGGKGAREAVHDFALSKSIEMAILAATETARGLAAMASPITAPLAAGHFTAAGKAAAAGALAGALAGVTAGGGGGGAGGSSGSGGFGRSFAEGPRGRSSGRDAPSRGEAILSRQGGSSLVQSQGNGSGSSSGGTTVIVQPGAFQALGFAPENEMIGVLRNKLQRHEQQFGASS